MSAPTTTTVHTTTTSILQSVSSTVLPTTSAPLSNATYPTLMPSLGESVDLHVGQKMEYGPFTFLFGGLNVYTYYYVATFDLYYNGNTVTTFSLNSINGNTFNATYAGYHIKLVLGEVSYAADNLSKTYVVVRLVYCNESS